jgi:hypothetical protein
MRLVAAFFLVSSAALIGYIVGRGVNRIDIETFDLQARVIRDLSRQLTEEHPDEYYIIE